MALLDFLRAPWKHSDPARRLEAVRRLEPDRRDVFVALAAHDPDANVRLAAVKRLADEADLRRALEHCAEGPARDLAQEKLARIVADWALSERDVDPFKALAWLEELDALRAPEKIFAELSVRSPSPDVRKGALARLSHASSFLAVALREGEEAIALDALSRLEKETHLESVARDAKCAAARKTARERLRALAEAKGPDKTALGRAKLAILLSTAEKAAAQCAEPGGLLDWEGLGERLEEAVREMEALQAEGLHVSAADRAHFAANVAAFRERRARHEEIEAARRARDAEEARVRAIREEVCEAMEALFANPGPLAASDVEELESRFSAAGTLEADAEDPWVERFRIARSRLRDRLRRQEAKAEAAESRKRHEAEHEQARAEAKKQHDARAAAAAEEARRREERARREAERKARQAEALAELEAVSAELEDIVERADYKGAEKRLRELREKGNAAVAALGKAANDEAGSRAVGRFQAAAGRLRETLDWNQWAHKKHKDELDRAREANIAAKTALCEEAEKLDALPDDEASHARILELQARWKATGYVPREIGDALWARFRKPIDAYFAARRERAAQALENDEGVSIREDICTEAESLGTLDRRDAAEKVRALQAEWRAAPPVPAHVERKLWARFRKACDKAFAN